MDKDFTVHREGGELLGGDLTEKLLQQAKEEAEVKAAVGFGTAEPVAGRLVDEKPIAAPAGLMARIQGNAVQFAGEEGDKDEGVSFETDVGGTQGKIAFQEEDGKGADFDEGGANVATADRGFERNHYGDRPKIGNWDDDDADDGPVDRSSVGMEDEMDDDPDAVPAEIRDDED